MDRGMVGILQSSSATGEEVVPKVLVLHAGFHGQTAKIAQRLASELGRQGCQAVLADITTSDIPSLAGYDGVVAGGAVHTGKFHRRLRQWARRHAGELSRRPSAFFSVCLGIQQGEAVRAEERRIVGAFFRESGWRPPQWEIFAGALLYTRYGFFTRLLMKRIARQAGGATDTSRDFEYTDWDQVRRFAQAFAEKVRGHSWPAEPAYVPPGVPTAGGGR